MTLQQTSSITLGWKASFSFCCQWVFCDSVLHPSCFLGVYQWLRGQYPLSMDSLSILLLHLVPPSQHGCSSDMVNKRPFLLSLPFSCVRLTGEFPGNQKTSGTALSGETSLSFAYLLIIGYDGRGYSVSSSVYLQFSRHLSSLVSQVRLCLPEFMCKHFSFSPTLKWSFTSQWKGLGFNWDNECLHWKRSLCVECWKGTLITAAAYPVIV